MPSYKLLSITRANDGKHRLKAVFINQKSNERKTTLFGSKGSSTFIDHKDPEKKRNYIARHSKIEEWKDPTAAGTLSRYILWNKSTLDASIKDFKSKFNV